ncbi:MAG: hypothetical protein J4O05_10775, partial [Chloroflexi bacterium]|nr:hypothetical protein [Chloroflexota bacterium]
RGHIGEEAVDQATQRGSVASGLLNQLTYRIALYNPSTEPCHLPSATGCRIAPTKRVIAGPAKPPLATARMAAIP